MCLFHHLQMFPFPDNHFQDGSAFMRVRAPAWWGKCVCRAGGGEDIWYVLQIGRIPTATPSALCIHNHQITLSFSLFRVVRVPVRLVYL